MVLGDSPLNPMEVLLPVDTQVLSAYRKLGVSSRVALTRALLDGAAEA